MLLGMSPPGWMWVAEPGCRQTLRLGTALQANQAPSHTGHQAHNGMAVGCSAVGHPGVWDSTWGIMWDHGALWVTMGWSSTGYHSMWCRGLPWGKDSHRQYQTPALHSRLACSWGLKMTQHSIAWMGGSATGACFPRDPVTPSLSPGVDLAEPWLLAQALPGVERHSCACCHPSSAKTGLD